jgi:N utilization substance protein B
MLSRRQLRIKVLQSLYAYIQSENDRMDQAERQLLQSIDRILDLSLHHISLVLEIVHFAEKRIEDGKTKYLPSPEDLNPNMRFVENPVVTFLKKNRAVNRGLDQLKISWHEHEDVIRKIFNQLRNSSFYQEYMNAKEVSFTEHRDVIRKLLNEIIHPMPVVQFLFEEKNLYWATDIQRETITITGSESFDNDELFRFVDKDVIGRMYRYVNDNKGNMEVTCEESAMFPENDYYMAIYMTEKFLRDITQLSDEFTQLPALLKTDDNNIDDDRDYVLRMFRKTLINRQQYLIEIAQRSDNWESERIALMDILILQMAICELTEIKTIPVKVTLNEYIELTKIFSSPSSKAFVNGLLNRLVNEMKVEGKIVKTGRGLLDE